MADNSSVVPKASNMGSNMLYALNQNLEVVSNNRLNYILREGNTIILLSHHCYCKSLVGRTCIDVTNH